MSFLNSEAIRDWCKKTFLNKEDAYKYSFNLIPYGDIIPNDSDLNDYNKAGNYRVLSATESKTIKNNPVPGRGFILYVARLYGINSANNVTQYIMTWYGDIWTRNYSASRNGGTWSDWISFASISSVDELKKSVSDGKSLVASAITDKGVNTDATATFQEMADNIGLISGEGEGGISSPISFDIVYEDLCISTYGLTKISHYFPVSKAKRLVLKSLKIGARKNNTSATTNTIYFRVMGIDSGTGAEKIIYSNYGSASSTAYKYNQESDLELDISDISEITRVYIYKGSGSVSSYYYNFELTANLEIYV